MQTSSKVAYRRSTAHDANAVFELVPASIINLAPDPYPQCVVDTWMDDRVVEDYLEDCRNQEIWIAEIEDVPIGFSHGVPGEIKRLFVDAKFMGRGAGTGLLKRALADALPGGSGLVRVDAMLNAVSFYQKWGFREVGRDVFPDRDEALPPIDVVIMEARFATADD